MRLGDHHTPETRRKISRSMRGVAKSDEHKRKIQRACLRHHAMKRARAELATESTAQVGEARSLSGGSK